MVTCSSQMVILVHEMDTLMCHFHTHACRNEDFLKLVDSLDLDGENRERTRLRLFQFSLRDQASNWLERLLARSITTWEDLTTRFLAHFFPPGRTAKLRNDILMFQQHHGESLSEAWTRFKYLLQKVSHHGIDRWLQIQISYDHVSFHFKCEIDRAAGGKLRNKNADECWEIIKNLALYDHEGPSPQPQALGTTFEARELTTSRTPKKVLIKEEAKFPVTKNVNSISLARGKEKRCDKTDETVDNTVKPTITKTEIQVMEAERSNETKNKLIKKAERKEVEEVLSSRPVEYYLMHMINEKLIEGLVDNNRFNDSLSRARVGKENEKRPFILGTPFLKTDKAAIKFDKGTITLRSGKSKISFYRIPDSSCMTKKGFKNDIEPIARTMTVNRLVLEWEERIKLHLEREMEFNQWRSKNFKGKRPTLITTKGGMDDEGEVM
ncbi:zinc finger, CCHC-type containing protein [Tanacetum coccineum]